MVVAGNTRLGREEGIALGESINDFVGEGEDRRLGRVFGHEDPLTWVFTREIEIYTAGRWLFSRE
jgi:hypothetical protein